VRELHNAVARHIALGDFASPDPRPSAPRPSPSAIDPLPAADAPPVSADTLEQILSMDLPFPHARRRVLDEFERRYVERVLGKNGGVVARAAAASGLARRYFQVIKARSR
jgi:hypothetical protein